MIKSVSLLLFISFFSAQAQNVFTRKDSLQGGLRPERTDYDVKRYDLNLTVNPEKKFISGFNKITFETTAPTSRIQVDLFENMQVDSIVFKKSKLKYTREFNAVFIDFSEPIVANIRGEITFYYSGFPIVAKNAPWDGGFVFSKDKNGKPWIATAVQGIGASLWIPLKDSQSDEPDEGATIKIAVPNGLMHVSNGRFIGKTDLKNGYSRWDWEVKSPINSYSLTCNIGDYVAIHDRHDGIDLDYYVLRGNEEIARNHFAEVKPMMDCFNSKFGQYPFTEDGYKLIETPYLGMEHQSAVAYGNKFKKGYDGRDLSGTGIGLLFDFITIHESGHEWFGNSITSRDVADMWIHESFTTYSESVFVECVFGADKAQTYINGLRRNIQNDIPIIGKYGVQNEGSGDMYYKGALMLNSIRHTINDDEKWWKILHDYATTFRHKIIDTETVISYFSENSAIDLTPIFNQFLRTTQIPTIQFQQNGKTFSYKWVNVVSDFNMPVDVRIGSKIKRLYPTNSVQYLKIGKKEIPEIVPGKFLINVTQNR